MPDYIRVPKKCVNVIDVKYILMGKEILIQLKHPYIQLPARTSPLLFMTEATSMVLSSSALKVVFLASESLLFDTQRPDIKNEIFLKFEICYIYFFTGC